jgi:DUF971 family protein
MTESQASITPEEVRAPKGARVMEITWSDGATTTHRHLHLRAFCPCAHCQGHQGPIRWVEGVEALPHDGLELSELDEVGQYALRLAWGDGHATGIYSFRYLRELGDLATLPEAEVRALRFGR